MSSIYNCTPAIGLGDIYDKVDVGDKIEYKSKKAKMDYSRGCF